MKLQLVQHAIKEMKHRWGDTLSLCEPEMLHKRGLNSLLAKDRCKFGVKSEMNRKFHKICQDVVSWVERGVTNTGNKDKCRGPTYCEGDDQWMVMTMAKNCDVGEFKTDRLKASGRVVGWDDSVRATPSDWWELMSSWCGRQRCVMSWKCLWPMVHWIVLRCVSITVVCRPRLMLSMDA